MDITTLAAEGKLDFSKMSKEQIQYFIKDVEEALLKLPQVPIPVRHYHAHDAYAREIDIPKGTILTGKMYKYEHINILSKGEITVLSIDGAKRIKAPYTVVSSAGVKRLAYAHEDCTWTTIFGTTEKDVEKIQDDYTTTNYGDVLKELKCQE